MMSPHLVQLLARERQEAYARDAELYRLVASWRGERHRTGVDPGRRRVLGRPPAGLRTSRSPSAGVRILTLARLLSHHEG
jgi:hypothetical protein